MMLFSSVSKLNALCGSSFQRVLNRRTIKQQFLIALVCSVTTVLEGHSLKHRSGSLQPGTTCPNYKFQASYYLRSFSALYPQCYSDVAASPISFSVSPWDEDLGNPDDSSDERNLEEESLKLISGSFYLPHPDKQETGGEDAHFICEDERVVGVADGVGGWAGVGVDAGKYARDLMSNSVTAIKEEPKDSIDPARVLDKAHSLTRALGSSTACIVALTNKGVHAINLGDSGFIVIRNGSIVFRSPAQQYSFNFTYQLASAGAGDLPSSGQVFIFSVTSEDVIVAGTDGLFDNLYNNEIAAVVVQSVRAGFDPHTTARKIAARAQERAKDEHRHTPFAEAAQEAGFRYNGGKLDDITVVVSYVSVPTSERRQ